MDILEEKKLEDDDAMRKLYDASMKGCVSTFNKLVQKDPLILSRVSLCPFTETPLHIASLLGYLEFCQVLLRNSPSLATELDSEGRCPLHLASAKGHTEVVKELLKTNPEMCLVRDKDDMLPLHFAAMRGRVGALKELIKSKPDSIEMVESGDEDGSVLQLCVRYNHLEALKLLVESLRGDRRFLLSVSEMSPEIRNLNKNSLTAMDTLNRYPGDFMRQYVLTEGIEKRALEVSSAADLTSKQQGTLSISRMEAASSQSIAVVIVQADPPQASSSPSLTNNDPPQTSAAPSQASNDPPEASSGRVSNHDPAGRRELDGQKDEGAIDGGSHCDCNDDVSVSDKPTRWCMARRYHPRWVYMP